MRLKTSEVANYIRKLFGMKESNLSIEETIQQDYYDCICYLYRGKEKPVIIGFKGDNCICLSTTVGEILLFEIPHNKCYLTNCANEIEVLVNENEFAEDYVVKLINDIIEKKWDR